MNDLISVIIPAFNVENYIERCLKSVLNQSFKNLEIIIINDGSTDHTGEIIDQLYEKDSRIIVIHKKNTGVSDSRNVGLEIANGNYIGFVDSDDEILPEMYEILYKNILKYNAEISHCGFELVTPLRKISFHGTNKIYIQNQKDALISLLEGYPFEPSNCSKLYCKKILNNVRYNVDIRINEDLLFNVEAFKNSKKIVFEDVILYRYMDNPNSAARSKFNFAKFESILNAASIIKIILSNYGINNELNRFYIRKILHVYQNLYKNKLNFINFIR